MDAPTPATASTPRAAPTATSLDDALPRLAARRAARRRFLHALYQAAGSSPNSLVSLEPFAATLRGWLRA